MRQYRSEGPLLPKHDRPIIARRKDREELHRDHTPLKPALNERRPNRSMHLRWLGSVKNEFSMRKDFFLPICRIGPFLHDQILGSESELRRHSWTCPRGSHPEDLVVKEWTIRQMGRKKSFFAC